MDRTNKKLQVILLIVFIFLAVGLILLGSNVGSKVIKPKPTPTLTIKMSPTPTFIAEPVSGSSSTFARPVVVQQPAQQPAATQNTTIIREIIQVTPTPTVKGHSQKKH